MSDLHYYLISLPFGEHGTQKVQQQYDQIRSQLDLPRETNFNLFEIPGLKVGTLDTLMDASDELTRVDPQIETATGKLVQYLEEITGQNRSEITKVRPEVTCDQYLGTFKWDDKRYDLREPTKALIDRISGEVVLTEEKVRSKLMEYNEAKKRLGQAQRKETGNLSIKPITETVKTFYKQKYGDENPIETEYLTTLFVVVPNSQQEDWVRSYWTLGELQFIIPGSSVVVAKDAEFTLNNVILFRKFLEDYKKECRKRKWVVRELQANDDQTGAQLESLQNSTDEFRGQLVRMLTTSFSECYQAYLHIKALRVFVESVLKYSLPPRFVSISFRITEKQERTLRSKLRTQYAYLQPKFEEVADSGALQNEFPYVSLKMINVNRSGR